MARRALVGAFLLGAVALAAVAAALALPPPGVRIVAGSMPGFPRANALRYPPHRLTAAARARLARRFAAIRVGDPAGPAVTAMGRIHELVADTPGNRCDFFDGGFVLCVFSGRVAANGYEE